MQKCTICTPIQSSISLVNIIFSNNFDFPFVPYCPRGSWLIRGPSYQIAEAQYSCNKVEHDDLTMTHSATTTIKILCIVTVYLMPEEIPRFFANMKYFCFSFIKILIRRYISMLIVFET